MGKKNLSELMNTAIEVENKMGAFYGMLSEKSLNDFWKQFWMQLKLEEENHADAIYLQKKLVVKRPSMVTTTESLEKIKECLEKVNHTISLYTEKDFNLEAKLETSIELEKLLRNFHTDNLVKIDDKSLAQLFETLASEDEKHIKTLENARDEHLSK